MLAFKKVLRRLAVSLLFVPLATLATAQITGTVTNRTTDKPSAGDEVTLLQLEQGMQEVTHTTSNAHGAFSLNTPGDGSYLVRVTYDKATYFGAVPAGKKTVDIEVYNVGAHVAGVTTEAEVMRAQTDASGGTLNVVEIFFIKNDSKPAMTQFSSEPFDFYLPVGAVVEGAAAMAPNGMPVSATPVALAEKGRYTFLFPIRPGETRFQIAYHVAYPGTYKFDLKIAGPSDAFAVIVPKSMNFIPVAGTPFNPLGGDATTQTFVAHKVTVGQPLGFQLTGTGALPRDPQSTDQGGQDAQGGGGNGAADTTSSDNAPGKGLGVPLDPNGTHEPVLTKYKYWILGGLGLLLVVAAGILLGKPKNAPVVAANAVPAGVASSLPATAVSPAGRREQLLQVLKEELFALETDRVQGHIDEADYLQQKAAIELTLRRALQLGAAPGGTPPTDTNV